ncbi:hypothetical protein ACIGO8_06240 [Streptomyces sp. NPDC053493]|uniref:hypothetical protein n=1 Tax=Streptomyces sp. NPDC053493 TaxID=3365705 RepID=UPI0037D670D7
MISSDDTAATARDLSEAAWHLRWDDTSVRELADRLGPPAEVSDDPPRLVVPVSRPEGEPLAQAREFRRVADALRAALGEPGLLGAHGHRRPPGRRADPRWGRPFLRWRRGGTTLELRAGAAGPELVLEPSETWESWYPDAGTGFVGVGEESGLSVDHPPHEPPADWEDLALTLAVFLRTLPAETYALGIAHCLPLYGRIAGSGAPLLFDIVSDDRLFLDFTEYEVAEAARGERVAALGWTRTDSLPPGHLDPGLDGGAPWRVDAGGPGEVDAGAAAALLVRTARAAGLDRPTDLLLGGEGEFRRPYRFGFPGLGLPTV